MIRVGVFLSSIPTDGGKFQYSLTIVEALKGLSNEKFKVIYFYSNDIWLNYFNNNDFIVKLIKPNIIQRIIRKITIKISFKIWRKISKFFNPTISSFAKHQPKLIFFPGNDSISYEGEFNAACPIFDLMHIYEKKFPDDIGVNISKARDMHYKNVCKYSKYILVDSFIGKSHVLENFSVKNNKIIVLPFVAPSYVKEYNNTKIDKDIINKYSLPNEFIFYPAQFWSHKNHNCLLEAIKILFKQGIYINAVFVGSKKEAYNKIVASIHNLNLKEQIYILDYVSNEDIIALYKCSQALVMPTFFGPTNIPPLEAFALGCPVIISDIYGHREQLDDAALFFNPNNPKELASKILKLMNNKNLKNSLINKGFKLSKEKDINHFRSELEILITK